MGGRFGITAELADLPRFQLGSIPWNTYPFLGTSAKAFSVLRKQAPVIPPNADQVATLSCWHLVLFQDTNKNTYFSPKLIRAGVTQIRQLMPQMQATLPPTLLPTYQTQMRLQWLPPRLPPPLRKHQPSFGEDGTHKRCSTPDLLLKLPEGGPRPTAVVSLVRPYKVRDYAALAASGA